MMGIKKTDNPLPKTHKDEQTKGRELKKEKINNAKEKKKKIDKASTPLLFCPHIPTCVSNFHLSRSIWQGY